MNHSDDAAAKAVTRCLLLAFACLVTPMSAAAEPAAAPATLKGKRYPAEHEMMKAEESGIEVIQLTTNPADDAKLYFTSTSFVPASHQLVFTSNRTGAWNLFLLDLKTFEFVQLTDSESIERGIRATVCPATREAFYVDGTTVKAVNLDTLAERTVVSAPSGYNVGAALSVTDKGDVLAFSITEAIKLTTTTSVIYSDMDEHFAKRPWSAVMIGRTDGTGFREIARQKKWVSHTMVSPTDPDLVLYCHEGRWNQVEQRMWLVNADGANNRKLRTEEMPELRIGHEFWLPDGIRVGYQSTYPNAGKMIGIADTRDGKYQEYPTEFSDSHVQVTPDGRWYVGDGAAKAPFINLYELKDGKLRGRHLFRHGSDFSKQNWHPHPSFSPDGGFVLFTGTRSGTGDIYLIRLPQ
jgi:oligogalacturonide lyase